MTRCGGVVSVQYGPCCQQTGNRLVPSCPWSIFLPLGFRSTDALALLVASATKKSVSCYRTVEYVCRLHPCTLPRLPTLYPLQSDKIYLIPFFSFSWVLPQQTPPLKDIAAAIKVSGISKIDLSMEEVKLIVNALVYDGELEEVRGAASRFNRDVS